ncbi:MAG TPA: hypothetical protein VGK67_26385 [Myxococcales bacterium]|jgi:hypothetical protein
MPITRPPQYTSVDSSAVDLDLAVDLAVTGVRNELARLKGQERTVWPQQSADLHHDTVEALAFKNKAGGELAAWTARHELCGQREAAGVAAHEARVKRIPILEAKLAALEAGKREEQRQREAAEREEERQAEAAKAEDKRLEHEAWLALQPQRDEAMRVRRAKEAVAAQEAAERVAEVESKGRAALAGKNGATA